MDEATSGLDPFVRDEILDIFNDFTRDESHTVLISSHIVSDLEKICDYIAFIHNGRLVFHEEKDRIMEKYSIVKCAQSDFEALDPQAIKGKKISSYGVEALAESDKIPGAFRKERANLEEIILFLAKGDN